MCGSRWPRAVHVEAKPSTSWLRYSSERKHTCCGLASGSTPVPCTADDGHALYTGGGMDGVAKFVGTLAMSTPLPCTLQHTTSTRHKDKSGPSFSGPFRRIDLRDGFSQNGTPTLMARSPTQPKNPYLPMIISITHLPLRPPRCSAGSATTASGSERT